MLWLGLAMSSPSQTQPTDDGSYSTELAISAVLSTPVIVIVNALQPPPLTSREFLE
eukprot:COSAG02_NODE_315_length_24910_cov_17.139978_4_plen_56_part_00